MVQLPSAHPAPCQPRPWHTRTHGECAFPVDGEGADTRSCCAPCTPHTRYCPPHLKRMRGARAPSYKDLLREFAKFLA